MTKIIAMPVSLVRVGDTHVDADGIRWIVCDARTDVRGSRTTLGFYPAGGRRPGPRDCRLAIDATSCTKIPLERR